MSIMGEREIFLGKKVFWHSPLKKKKKKKKKKKSFDILLQRTTESDEHWVIDE